MLKKGWGYNPKTESGRSFSSLLLETSKINVIDININKLLKYSSIVLAIFMVIFLIWWNKKIIIINRPQDIETSISNNKNLSIISGLECQYTSQRPIAVMLAGDLIDRPLSGLGQADLVFEMPVAPNGITRFMAVFQCEHPEEIGSVRSARNEFIPLSAGIGAILVHWGGEHEALTKLNAEIIDNIDAMKYEGTTFYRKSGLKPPHNGFTDLTRITDKSQELKYNLSNNFAGYSHEKSADGNKNISNITDEINVYQAPFDVKWIYDKDANVYKRIHGNTPEIDRGISSQVQASVVAVIKTTSKVLNELYISVGIPGQGTASIYQNGIVINGTWIKDSSRPDSKLYFYDNNGKEIEFTAGKIWVEITTN